MIQILKDEKDWSQDVYMVLLCDVILQAKLSNGGLQTNDTWV